MAVGDLELRLGLIEGALSTLLLTRGGGEGDRGECLRLRLAEGGGESFLMGDLDFDLLL